MFKLFSRKDAFKATVNDLGKPIEVEPSSNLLQAALAAGVAWPHSCRVGSCGTCRCRLVSGRIKELSDFSYVLEEDELDRGMILACQTSLRSDIVVEVDLDTTVGKVAKPESIKGVISGSTPLTHDILEIRVHLEKPLPRYIAGQYAEISVAGIDHPRSYSFARAPENEKSDDVTFHVRHVPGGEMSGWLHAESRIGQEVVITGPFGSFHLRDSQSPILCIAGGSGMAPIKALLECLCTSGFKRQVTYLFGARTQKDLYCLDEMDAVKAKGNDHFRFLPILSNEPDGSSWSGRRGLVTSHITDVNLDLASCEAYLCGPPPMIDAAIEVLNKEGLGSERIFFDKFFDTSHLPGGRGNPPSNG